MPHYRYGAKPNEWSGESEYSLELQLQGNTVQDTNGESTPALQTLLPIIQKLHDPNPELIIQYEYQGSYEPDTWDCPGGTCHEVWPTGAYLLTQTGLTDLDDQPTTTTDPEYQDLHLQDRLTQPGKPQKIPLDKETTEALFNAYEKAIEQDDTDPGLYEDIQKISNTITEDPDIFN